MISSMDTLSVGERALAFRGLGQVGVAIKGPDGAIYIDPYLTDSDGAGGRLEREFPPPLKPDEVTNASAVLLTHDHIDHTDPETILPMSQASPEVRVVCPFTSRETLVGGGAGGGTHRRAGGRGAVRGGGSDRNGDPLGAHGAGARSGARIPVPGGTSSSGTGLRCTTRGTP